MLERESASDQMGGGSGQHFWADRFFGELALLDDGLSTASAIASEPTR